MSGLDPKEVALLIAVLLVVREGIHQAGYTIRELLCQAGRTVRLLFNHRALRKGEGFAHQCGDEFFSTEENEAGS
jgi:hypothetical protein